MKVIQSFQLTAVDGETNSIAMPRRARVLAVGATPANQRVFLYAEVEHNDDTAAFDVRHQRHFVVVHEGMPVPEGAGHVGSYCFRNEGWHVFEVKTV